MRQRGSRSWLYPQQVRADWINDRIGEWLQHYRHDLHVQGKTYAATKELRLDRAQHGAYTTVVSAPAL